MGQNQSLNEGSSSSTTATTATATAPVSTNASPSPSQKSSASSSTTATPSATVANAPVTSINDDGRVLRPNSTVAELRASGFAYRSPLQGEDDSMQLLEDGLLEIIELQTKRVQPTRCSVNARREPLDSSSGSLYYRPYTEHHYQNQGISRALTHSLTHSHSLCTTRNFMLLW
jgi:hypothetical protein